MSEVLQMDGQGPFDDLDPPKNSAFGRLFKKFLALFISDTVFLDIDTQELTTDDVRVNTASGAPIAGVATLVAGAATVATTKVEANSIVQLTPVGALAGHSVGRGAIVAGTSFAIASSDNTDTRSVAWAILNPKV